MQEILSYRGNRHKHTHPQTGPITIHCTAASTQCNEKWNEGLRLKWRYHQPGSPSESDSRENIQACFMSSINGQFRGQPCQVTLRTEDYVRLATPAYPLLQSSVMCADGLVAPRLVYSRIDEHICDQRSVASTAQSIIIIIRRNVARALYNLGSGSWL